MNLTLSTFLILFYLLDSTTSFFRKCRVPFLANGRVKVRSRGRALTFKCSRRFLLFGEYTDAVCVNGEWYPPAIPKCIRGGCDDPGRPENGARVYIFSGAMITFRCDPGHTLNGDGTLTCDGYTWNGTRPTCVAPEIPPETSCDFETPNLCGWSQEISLAINETAMERQFLFDTLNWAQMDFPVPNASLNTGPLKPHSNAFLFLESSNTEENRSASIFSPVYKPELSVESCMALYISMHGATMGTLNILQLPEGADAVDEIVLKSISGNLGSGWHKMVVWLRPMIGNFQIIVQGLVGKSYLSDMAIDDFNLLQGKANCTDAMQTGSLFEVKTALETSPSSCYDRCGVDAVVVNKTYGWEEGFCDCTPNCLLNFDSFTPCCVDYIYLCHELASGTDLRPAFMQQLGISWPLMVVVLVSVLALGILLVLGLQKCSSVRKPMPNSRRLRGARAEVAEDSDLQYMMGPDIEEQEIDFRLAAPEVRKEDRPEGPIVHPRALTKPVTTI